MYEVSRGNDLEWWVIKSTDGFLPVIIARCGNDADARNIAGAMNALNVRTSSDDLMKLRSARDALVRALNAAADTFKELSKDALATEKDPT